MNLSPLHSEPRDNHFHPYPRKQAKRRFQNPVNCTEQPLVLRSDRIAEPRLPARGDRQIAIRLDDRDAQAKWFSDAFKAVQQVACRTIAKAWIKKIHPKKASLLPACILLC
jgi:Protein of unknown function (DUF2841)